MLALPELPTTTYPAVSKVNTYEAIEGQPIDGQSVLHQNVVLPPIKWYGGKIRLARRFAALLPPHKVYVEPFCGSAALLYAKAPSEVEIVNDLDGELVNFLRILRDQEPELTRRLRVTPYSRAEYVAALEQRGCTADPIERAREFFLLVMQSLNGRYSGGWSRELARNRAKPFHNAVERLSAAAGRLRNVQIENRDYLKLITEADGKDVLFYLDPPYLPETRAVPQRYQQETSRADHEKMLRVITHLQGMVALSGYPHPLYDRALSDWARLSFDVPNNADVRHGASGRRGRRQEVIWMNPLAAARYINVRRAG